MNPSIHVTKPDGLFSTVVNLGTRRATGGRVLERCQMCGISRPLFPLCALHLDAIADRNVEYGMLAASRINHTCSACAVILCILLICEDVFAHGSRVTHGRSQDKTR